MGFLKTQKIIKQLQSSYNKKEKTVHDVRPGSIANIKNVFFDLCTNAPQYWWNVEYVCLNKSCCHFQLESLQLMYEQWASPLGVTAHEVVCVLIHCLFKPMNSRQIYGFQNLSTSQSWSSLEISRDLDIF